MPAATTKDDLLAVTIKEWRKLEALLDRVPEALRSRAFGEDGTLTDLLNHRAHWIGLFFQWLEEGAQGGPVAMPDHGVKWSELKAYNAGLRARYATRDWDAARAALQAGHARLVGWIEAQDEETLYGAPMPGGTGWTRGRYAEAAGPSHYRSAAKHLRACLRAAG